MKEKMYSVDEVADHLGLHVRTVRGYIRDGRLKATRIGKQYRIAPADLEALTGGPEPSTTPTIGAPSVEVSSIVQIDGVDRTTADRLSTFLQAGAGGAADPAHPLRLQVVHDAERARLKIVILGDATSTADLLRTLATMVDDSDLFGP